MIFDNTKFRMLVAKFQYTNHTLAQKVGTTPGYISQFKSGKRQPSYAIVNKLVEAFELDDFKELFKDEDDEQKTV
jgi:DNA-binding XRE family transcriptional regulator